MLYCIVFIFYELHVEINYILYSVLPINVELKLCDICIGAINVLIHESYIKGQVLLPWDPPQARLPEITQCRPGQCILQAGVSPLWN